MEEQKREKWEKFILAHERLVMYAARTMCRNIPLQRFPHIDFEDIVQDGWVGLIEASFRYKSDKGTSFKTYACTRVRGEIIDQLRALSWVSRKWMQRKKEYDKAISAIEKRVNRTPLFEEIAEELDITEEELSIWVGYLRRRIDSLEQVVGQDEEGNNFLVKDFVKAKKYLPEIEAEKSILNSLFFDRLIGFPKRDRNIFFLHYYKGQVMKEIGEKYGIAEGRVSQILVKMKRHLEERMRRYVLDSQGLLDTIYDDREL